MFVYDIQKENYFVLSNGKHSLLTETRKVYTLSGNFFLFSFHTFLIYSDWYNISRLQAIHISFYCLHLAFSVLSKINLLCLYILTSLLYTSSDLHPKGDQKAERCQSLLIVDFLRKIQTNDQTVLALGKSI